MIRSAPTIPNIPPIPRQLVEKANALYVYLNQPGDQLGKRLQAVYRYSDELCQFISKFMSCSRGCSFCCSIDVQITTLEAHYIQEQSRIRASGGTSITTGHRDPCPFVASDGSCSIYTFRPLACRIYHAAGEPINCRPGGIQLQYGHPPLFGNEIFANLIGWTQHVTIGAGGTVRDIRDFFPVATRLPAHFP